MADEDNINVQATGDASGLVSAMQQSVAASQALLAAVTQLNANLAATTATTTQVASGLGQTTVAAKTVTSQFVGLGQAVDQAAAQTTQATTQTNAAVQSNVTQVGFLQQAWNNIVGTTQSVVASFGTLSLSLDAISEGFDTAAAHGRTLSIAMDAVGWEAGEAASKVLAGAGAIVVGLKSAALGFLAVAAAAVALVATVDLLKESVKASAEYADAMDKLRVAVEAAGGAFESVRPQVEEWLELQRKTTAFDPVDLINGLTKLREAGLTVGQAMQSMRVAEDVAAGSGKSLNDIAQALAQTYDGRTRALTQLNVATRESIAAGTNYAAVLQALEDHYGSQATAAVDQYRGAHEQLDNAITALEKTIGDKLTPGLIDLMHHLTDFINDLDETKASQIGQWFLDVANSVLVVTKAVTDLVSIWDTLYQNARDPNLEAANIKKFMTTPHDLFGGGDANSGGLAQAMMIQALGGAVGGSGNNGQLSNPVNLAGLPTTEVGGETDASKKKKAEEEAKKAAEDRFHTQMAYIEELRSNNQTNYQEEIAQLQDLAAHYATTAQERYEVETKIGEIRREGVAQAVEDEKKIAEAQKQTLTTYEENSVKAIEIKHNAEIEAGKSKQQADAEELASLKILASTELFTDAQKLDLTLKIGDLKKTFAQQDREVANQAAEASQKAINDADDLIIRQLKLGGILAANAAIQAKKIINQVGPPTVDDQKNIDAVMTALQEYYAKDSEVSAKVIENQVKVEEASIDANTKVGASRLLLHNKILQMAIDELKAQQAQYAAMGAQGKQAYDNLQKIIDADSIEIQKNIADIKKAYENYVDEATKQTASLIDDLVIKHKSLKSELSSIYDQILQAYVSMIAKMIVESKLFQQVFPFMGGSGSSSSQGGIFGGFISSVTGGGSSSKPDGSAGNPIYVTTADITAQAAQKLTGSTTGVAVGSITNIANTTPPSGDLASSPENAWGMASGAGSGTSPSSNALAKTIGNSVAGAITGASLGTTAAGILNPGGNQQMAGDFSAVAGAVGAHLMLVNPLLGAGIMVGAGLLGSLFGPHETAAEQPDINDPTWGTDLVNWQGASANVNGQLLTPGSQYNTSNGGTSQAAQFSDWVAGESKNVSALTPAQQQLYTQIVGLMGGNANAGAAGLNITAEHQGNVDFANGQSMSVTAFEQLVSNFGTTVGTTIGNLLIPIFDVQHALPDYAGASVNAAGTYSIPTTAAGTTAPTGTGSTNPVTNASGAGVVVNVQGSVIASQDLATQLETIVGNGMYLRKSAGLMDYV